MTDEQGTPQPTPTGTWGTPSGEGLDAGAVGTTPTPDATMDAAMSTAPAATTAASSPANLDGAARNVFFGSMAVAIIGVVGLVTGTWLVTWPGLILVGLGAAAAGLIWLGATSPRTSLPIPGRYVELLTGLVATVIGLGGVMSAVFDLDELGEADFIVDTLVYVLLAAVGLFLLLATGRAWPGGTGAIAKPVRPSAALGGRLAFVGVLLVMLGWLVNVTVGVWNWHPGALVTFLVLLVAVILLMIADDAWGPRIPVPAAWIAAGVAIWAGLIALVEHVQGFLGNDDLSPGIEDWVGMILYVAGIVLVVVGTVMLAANARPAAGASTPDTPAPPPAA
jgi:hypothetical protein